MGKKYIMRVTFIMLFFIIAYVNQVFAANNYSCNVLITENKTELKAGETITYEIKATDINANTGVIIFETLIDYNENIFSCNVESDDAKEWNSTSLIENYITMTRNDLLPNAEDQVIAKVILTAKENATVGKQTINFTKIRFTMDNNEYFEVGSISKSLEIVGNQIENQEDINNENNEENGYQQSQEIIEQEANIGEVQQNQQIQQANLSSNITNKQTLPYAGITNILKVVAIIVLLITLTVVIYNKYRKVKDI